MQFLKKQQNNLNAAAEKIASYQRKLANRKTITD